MLEQSAIAYTMVDVNPVGHVWSSYSKAANQISDQTSHKCILFLFNHQLFIVMALRLRTFINNYNYFNCTTLHCIA